MLLKFGPTLISDNITLDTLQARQPLTIKLPSSPSSPGLTTLIFYDTSAPYPENNFNSPYLHYLLVNIPNSDVKRGQDIVKYKPPHPPANSLPHVYVVGWYEQKEEIEMEKEEDEEERVKFGLQDFIDENGLELKDEKVFRVSPLVKNNF